MRKKWFSMILAATLATSVLTGCGSGGSAAQATETAQPAETGDAEAVSEEVQEGETQAEELAGGEPVTLRFAWWGSDARHEATLAAIERYTELHPNVTIEGEYQGYDGYQQKLMTQMAGKTEPDLMQLDYVWYPDLASDSDIFVDMEADPNVDLSVYSEDMLKDYCSINDKVIALPMGLNGFGIMINTSFFEKHGIPLDTVWTWEEGN